jgi:hypothetical protein
MAQGLVRLMCTPNRHRAHVMSRGDRATCLGRQRFPGLPLTTYASSGAPSNTTSPEIMPGAYHTLSTQLHLRALATPLYVTGMTNDLWQHRCCLPAGKVVFITDREPRDRRRSGPVICTGGRHGHARCPPHRRARAARHRDPLWGGVANAVTLDFAFSTALWDPRHRGSTTIRRRPFGRLPPAGGESRRSLRWPGPAGRR